MKSANESPKLLNCHSAPGVTIWVGAATEGKKQQALTVPPPSQPGYLTSRMAPLRVAKEARRAPPRVKISPSRVSVEASVTVPPAYYNKQEKHQQGQQQKTFLHRNQEWKWQQEVNTS